MRILLAAVLSASNVGGIYRAGKAERQDCQGGALREALGCQGQALTKAIVIVEDDRIRTVTTDASAIPARRGSDRPVEVHGIAGSDRCAHAHDDLHGRDSGRADAEATHEQSSGDGSISRAQRRDAHAGGRRDDGARFSAPTSTWTSPCET